MRPYTALFLGVIGFVVNAAEGADFNLPGSGCPMAHCDNQMSNRENMIAPVDATNLTLISHDTTTAGSNIGLGCASNGAGNTVACTLSNGTGPDLVVYDGAGSRKWSSSLLSQRAYASAPIVDSQGGVIVADDRAVIRFDPSGNVLWLTPTPGGTPISPVIVEGTTILLATKGGPVSIYAINDGHLIGSLTIRDPQTGLAYDTVNTPSVNGSACYISMQARLNPSHGNLVRVDVDPAAATPLAVKWNFPFGGPSGGSAIYDATTNSLYFDGASVTPGGNGPAVLFAVADQGSTPVLKWTVQLPGQVVATGALDPRGGVWSSNIKSGILSRFDGASGRVLQSLDLNALIDSTGHVPASPTLIAQNSQGTPIMILGSVALTNAGASFVVALDLTPAAGALLWKYKVASSVWADAAYGQFPIVSTADGKPRVVFTTFERGAFFLGEP